MTRLLVLPVAVLTLFAAGCRRPAPAPEPDEPGAPAPKVVLSPNPQPAVREVAPMPREAGPRLAIDLGARPVAGALPVAPFPHEPGEGDLTNEDISLGAGLEAALPGIERLDKVAVENVAVAPPNIGIPVPPGLDATVGLPGAAGAFREDPPAKGPAPGPFAGRSGATRAKLLKEFGGTEQTERAVALGLAWLAKQQKKDGSWEFDQGQRAETAAATGFALLAFLGAGETHRDAKGKYQKTVRDGVNWLAKATTPNGANVGRVSTSAYAQGIATLALVEAYGMTKDAALKPTAQAAINYIQKAQGANGSWGYAAGTNGDTSITGWQLQALTAAKQSGLAVDDKVVKKALMFLDTTAAGAKKDRFGYRDTVGAAPGTALTAIGLWSRLALDGWTPDIPGLVSGAEGLLKRLPTKDRIDTYHLHYATLVMRGAGEDAWADWNEGPKGADGSRKGGFRDVLVGAQVQKEGATTLGSWDPDRSFIGENCGRLGTTALCVISLESYYRPLPPAKKDVKDDPKK